MGRRTEIEFEAGLVGQIRNTGRSPLTTLSQSCILGARVWKDMCLPREARYVSNVAVYCKLTGLTGKTGETKSPALVLIVFQTLMSLVLSGIQIMDAAIFRQLSEQTARGDYRVVGVSRGHSSLGEFSRDEGLNGATYRMVGVNERGE
ncbi:hypothetical protein ACFL1Z_05680 [Thermodesulfobacteriota bacterium]